MAYWLNSRKMESVNEVQSFFGKTEIFFGVRTGQLFFFYPSKSSPFREFDNSSSSNLHSLRDVIKVNYSVGYIDDSIEIMEEPSLRGHFDH